MKENPFQIYRRVSEQLKREQEMMESVTRLKEIAFTAMNEMVESDNKEERLASMKIARIAVEAMELAGKL